MNCIDFLNNIITHLTGKAPDIEVEHDEHGAVITIKVYGNISPLIGKQGATIDAIRTLVKAIGIDGKHRLKLRINEDT